MTSRNDSSSPDNSPSSHPFSTEVTQFREIQFDHLMASGMFVELIRERGYRSTPWKKQLADFDLCPAQWTCRDEIPKGIGELVFLEGPLRWHIRAAANG